MTAFLQKIFHIYPEEQKNAFVFALLGFLWAFASTAVLKFTDALFLLHVGAESLPTVYKLTAGALILLASLLLYSFNNFSIRNIFLACLSAGFLFYTTILICIKSKIGLESDYIWYSLRIFGSLFFTLLCTCFWTFVDHYHHLQDAKRLYSLFTSAIFVGIACTGVLMNSGLLGFEHLVAIVLVVIIGTASLVLFIARHFHEVHDENESLSSSHFTSVSWTTQLASIFKSKFTLLLMSANFITYLLLVLTEYNYMSTFSAYFNLKEMELEGQLVQNTEYTHFFGQWLAIASVCNLLFGLFIYSRLIRRFGVVNLVFITPTILLISFLGWSFTDTLLYPIMGVFVVEGTLYVLDDNNFNLLLNAVPAKLKYKIRLFIESFFEPIGMLVSSLLISIDFVDSKVLGLILATALILVACAMKVQYLKGIYKNLAENAIHFYRSVSDWFNTMSDKEKRLSENRLLEILSKGDPKIVPAVLDAIVKTEQPHLIQSMLAIVDSMHVDVKIECVQQLLHENQVDPGLVVNHLNAWLYENKNEDLKGYIHYYLAIQGWLHPEKAMEDVHHSNLLIRGAAILSLNKSWEHLSSATIESNRLLSEKHLTSLLSSDKEDEKSMGLTIMGFVNHSDIPRVLTFLQDESLKVARSAAEALTLMGEEPCLNTARQIVNALKDSRDTEFKTDCLKALRHFGSASIVKELILASDAWKPLEKRLAETVIASYGSEAAPVLLDLMKDLQLHHNCRILAARALGRLDLKTLRENIGTIIQSEVQQAHFYYYYQHTILKDHPDGSLHMLQQALFSGYQSVINFVIQLLGVAGEIEDCELLTRSINSPNPKIRSQVVEALEKTCEAKIFRLVYPLVSDVPMKEKLEIFNRDSYPSTVNALLELLERSAFYIDQTVASLFKGQLHLGLLDKLLSKPTLAEKPSLSQ